MRRREFAARVWAKLVRFEKSSRLFGPGDRVLAAVSGGPDSVCLAHYLDSRRRKLGFDLALAYVHHGLRPEAAREAAFVERLAKSLGLAASVLKVDARKLAAARRAGIEEAARKARYEALAREARRLRFSKVATGHQLDDQAETVLLNLLRGGSLRALAAMPPRRTLSGSIQLVRPLLPLRRSDVLAYIERHGLRYRIDRSNFEARFLRNWLRRKILPALERRQPRTAEHLSRLAEEVRGQVWTWDAHGNPPHGMSNVQT